MGVVQNIIPAALKGTHSHAIDSTLSPTHESLSPSQTRLLVCSESHPQSPYSDHGPKTAAKHKSIYRTLTCIKKSTKKIIILN